MTADLPASTRPDRSENELSWRFNATGARAESVGTDNIIFRND
jgi:hypothetical protein